MRIYNKEADKDATKDDRKDYGEGRYCVLGFIENRLHSVEFTPREGKPRVISLREANKREVKRYEKAIQSRKYQPR